MCHPCLSIYLPLIPFPIHPLHVESPPDCMTCANVFNEREIGAITEKLYIDWLISVAWNDFSECFNELFRQILWGWTFVPDQYCLAAWCLVAHHLSKALWTVSLIINFIDLIRFKLWMCAFAPSQALRSSCQLGWWFALRLIRFFH